MDGAERPPPPVMLSTCLASSRRYSRLKHTPAPKLLTPPSHSGGVSLSAAANSSLSVYRRTTNDSCSDTIRVPCKYIRHRAPSRKSSRLCCFLIESLHSGALLHVYLRRSGVGLDEGGSPGTRVQALPHVRRGGETHATNRSKHKQPVLPHKPATTERVS
jgi:hypothetical protein